MMGHDLAVDVIRFCFCSQSFSSIDCLSQNVIVASLCKSHTSVTALSMCVCMVVWTDHLL